VRSDLEICLCSSPVNHSFFFYMCFGDWKGGKEVFVWGTGCSCSAKADLGHERGCIEGEQRFHDQFSQYVGKVTPRKAGREGGIVVVLRVVTAFFAKWF